MMDVSATAPFDYGSVTPVVANELKTIADRVRVAMRKSLLDIGQDLIAAKAMLDHGAFGPWVKAEFDFDLRAAQKHMQVLRRFEGKSEIISLLPPTVAQVISAPSFPEAACEAVVEKVLAGEKVTVASAHNIAVPFIEEVRKQKDAEQEAALLKKKRRDRARREKREIGWQAERAALDEQRLLQRAAAEKLAGLLRERMADCLELFQAADLQHLRQLLKAAVAAPDLQPADEGEAPTLPSPELFPDTTDGTVDGSPQKTIQADQTLTATSQPPPPDDSAASPEPGHGLCEASGSASKHQAEAP